MNKTVGRGHQSGYRLFTQMESNNTAKIRLFKLTRSALRMVPCSGSCKVQRALWDLLISSAYKHRPGSTPAQGFFTIYVYVYVYIAQYFDEFHNK